MPFVIGNLSGEDILTITGDPYGTLEVNRFADPRVSGMPGAMAGENFVIAGGVATAGSVLKYSTNGTTWQDVTLTGVEFTQGFDAAYDGNSTWIASGTGNVGGTIIFSSDSVNWANVNQIQLMSAQVAGVCYAPDNYWYAVGYDNSGQNTIIRSSVVNNPLNWDTYMLSASSAYFDVYSPGNPAVGTSIASDGNRTLVAVGYASPTNAGILWADTQDGKTWSNATLDTGGFLPTSDGIAYNGFLWVSSGTYGIMASTDGKVWKVVATPYAFSGLCVGWNGQYWMVGGNSSSVDTAAMYYSYDGFSWEPTTIPAGVVVQAICWNGTYWIAGGQNFGSFVTYSPDAPSAAFITSVDGVNWQGSAGGTDTFDVQVNVIANRFALPNAASPGPAIILKGIGEPPLSLGKTNDFYYDTSAFGLYGPKTFTETLGSNGSMFFTSKYGTVSTDPSSAFMLASDFTIQFWLNTLLKQGLVFSVPTNTGIPGYPGEFFLNINQDNSIAIGIDASTEIIANSVTQNQWSYYSIVRSSASGLLVYSNGSNLYSNINYATNTIGNTSGGLIIGAAFNGLITNFQWVNGYADPSASFVPTSPLTALPGANLLLLAEVDLSGNTKPTLEFVDSTGNYTMTATGNVMWSGDNPFQTNTTSWGNPVFPPRQRATPNTYYGSGIPATPPVGSQSGDIYYDTNTYPYTKYIIN